MPLLRSPTLSPCVLRYQESLVNASQIVIVEGEKDCGTNQSQEGVTKLTLGDYQARPLTRGIHRAWEGSPAATLLKVLTGPNQSSVSPGARAVDHKLQIRTVGVRRYTPADPGSSSSLVFRQDPSQNSRRAKVRVPGPGLPSLTCGTNFPGSGSTGLLNFKGMKSFDRANTKFLGAQA
ncbi:hypothetical protein NDU88_000412 [Pleurodeles waltl]|uniref:Uncharacterized protein n=1 Tax=Pleurodeles waltl TaxID=8319 RepID=A0AAV7V5L4_PLEWA|nr:hypothetical protein NDU88_000412 [Pleurodeles waltl]